MTYAWCGHLRDLTAKPLWVAIGVSWLVAFFEYRLQVPANRIGANDAGHSLAQLKVMQEVVTMLAFAAFAAFCMKEKLHLNFVYAGLCLVAAAWFMFRDLKPAA